MRNNITEIFFNRISPYLSDINKIAIVGGDITDPEIKILAKVKKSINVDRYGLDEILNFLDLNLSFNSTEKYDLVVCSQVLEHLYDVKQSIENLSNLTRQGGYIWVGCPASNRSHGSPDYYSAGYQPELIINLFNLFSVKALDSGVIGSKRIYFMTHALRIWPSPAELRRPITKYDFNRRKENIFLKFIRFFYDLPGRVYSSILPFKTINTVEYGTETWVLAQKLIK